jgi:DNA-binding NtrC family response regulator
VGGIKTTRVDVRLIAATNRDLAQEIETGRFRKDLFYRLNVVTLTLPPLRERTQVIPLLIDHFLRSFGARHGRRLVAVDAEAQDLLLAYSWPGNVRELQNVLERALVLVEQDIIGPEHLPPEVRGAAAPAPAPRSSGYDGPAGEFLPMAEVERMHVTRALERTGGNREEAARLLGISRRTLSRMIQRWGLPRRWS